MMVRRYELVLCLSLLHRLASCSSEVAPPSSQGRRPASRELPVVNAKNVANGFGVVESADDESRWDLDRVLRVWNPIAVSRIWRNETYRDAGVSLPCGEDLTRYLTGVSRKANWALRSKCANERDRIKLDEVSCTTTV